MDSYYTETENLTSCPARNNTFLNHAKPDSPQAARLFCGTLREGANPLPSRLTPPPPERAGRSFLHFMALSVKLLKIVPGALQIPVGLCYI